MSQKVIYNEVEKDCIWRNRIKNEVTANLNHALKGIQTKAGKGNMDFWNHTQTSVIFSNHGYKPDYNTTNEVSYGPRAPPVTNELAGLKVPENYFIPDVGYATEYGESYGYGDEYMRKSLNL